MKRQTILIAAAASMTTANFAEADTLSDAMSADCTAFVAADIDPQIMRPDIAEFYRGMSTVLDMMWEYYLQEYDLETGIPFNRICLDEDAETTEEALKLAIKAFLDSVASQSDQATAAAE
ncbi:hypothetical protein [Salipiger thiooxidans]|uniref:hypothetical protein n=1 Tax=Salipiger thiooxidans TaxID=282683 RepID=UPI001CF9F5B7|nr:hypothetical protein [Salipiger thiooxidans]